MNLSFPIAQKSVLLITILCVSFMSCNRPEDTSKMEEVAYENRSEVLDTISYQVADHYFAKSNVDANFVEKIETLEKFNELFGSATVMGMDTTNFPVNFSSNYVLAVILPESNMAEKIVPESLIKKSDGNIEFTYSILSGQLQSSSSLPSLVVVVNKLNDGHIVFINKSEIKK